MYTIVITCKGKPELLKKLLDGIETSHNIEIIVFDIDAENDEIEKICNESKFNIKRIATNKMGMASCLDIGICTAKNEIIIYCQDDIIPTPFCFDRLFEIYTNQFDYTMLSPNIKETHSNFEDGNGIREITQNEDYSGRVFACFIITKKEYIFLGRIDTNFYPVYYEDRDFLYKMHLNKCRFGCVLDIQVQHLAGSTVRDAGSYAGFLARSDEYYKKKWGGSPGNETFIIPFNGEKWAKW